MLKIKCKNTSVLSVTWKERREQLLPVGMSIEQSTDKALPHGSQKPVNAIDETDSDRY